MRNTEYIYGIIVYAGIDTKLSLNQKNPPSKFSRMEVTMNRIVIGVFLFQFVMVIICAIVSGIFQVFFPFFWFSVSFFTMVLFQQQNYVYKAGMYFGSFSQQSADLTGVLDFFAYFVLFSFLIPMSMMVTLELVKVAQTMWMEWDERMRLDPSDSSTGMNAKTSNLNDELALVKKKNWTRKMEFI